MGSRAATVAEIPGSTRGRRVFAFALAASESVRERMGILEMLEIVEMLPVDRADLAGAVLVFLLNGLRIVRQLPVVTPSEGFAPLSERLSGASMSRSRSPEPHARTLSRRTSRIARQAPEPATNQNSYP